MCCDINMLVTSVRNDQVFRGEETVEDEEEEDVDDEDDDDDDDVDE